MAKDENSMLRMVVKLLITVLQSHAIKVPEEALKFLDKKDTKSSESAQSADQSTSQNGKKAPLTQSRDGWKRDPPPKSANSSTKEEEEGKESRPELTGRETEELVTTFNVPARKFTELSLELPGVALATKKHSLQAASEFAHSTCAVAVLAPCPILGQGTPLQVITKDASGQQQSRACYLVHLGKSVDHVAPTASQAPSYQPPRSPTDTSTAVVSLTYLKRWTEKEVWNPSLLSPLDGARRWVHVCARARTVDIWRPKQYFPANPEFQRVLVRVDKSFLKQVLKASGKHGVFTSDILRTVDGKEVESPYRIVWLPEGTDLEEAQRQEGRMEYAVGLWGNGEGSIGVRVPVEHFHKANTAIHGAVEADRLSADRWRMKGVPLNWGRTEVAAAAGKCNGIFT